jgi:hypothetical protein
VSLAALHITPELCALAYELLRATKPFKGWNLPPAAAVEFTTNKSMDTRGYYIYHAHRKKKSVHEISVSLNCIGNLKSLVEVMAHEMIHLEERVSCTLTPGAMHNAAFMRKAKGVCKHHSFDFKLFV